VASPILLATVFFLGVTVAFTPCYLPVIPVLLTAVSRSGSRKGAAVALFTLGAFTSMTIYGAAVVESVNVIGDVLAARMSQLPVLVGYLLVGLGVTELTSLGEVFSYVPLNPARLRGAGLLQSFLAGFLLSLAAAPCSIAPMTAYVLSAALEGARGGDAYSLVLSFSAGIGSALLLVGLAASLLGKRASRALTRGALVRHHAKLSGALLVLLGTLTILSGEVSAAVLARSAEEFVLAAELLGAVAGLLTASAMLRAGSYLRAVAPSLMGAGLALMSAQRALSALAQVGVGGLDAPSQVLFAASRAALLVSVVGFLAAGSLLALPAVIPGGAQAYWADLAIAALWFAAWVKKDKHLALGAPFFLAAALAAAIHSVPDFAKPLIASLIVPMHLSILPAWRKTSSALGVLRLLEEA